MAAFRKNEVALIPLQCIAQSAKALQAYQAVYQHSSPQASPFQAASSEFLSYEASGHSMAPHE